MDWENKKRLEDRKRQEGNNSDALANNNDPALLAMERVASGPPKKGELRFLLYDGAKEAKEGI